MASRTLGTRRDSLTLLCVMFKSHLHFVGLLSAALGIPFVVSEYNQFGTSSGSRNSSAPTVWQTMNAPVQEAARPTETPLLQLPNSWQPNTNGLPVQFASTGAPNSTLAAAGRELEGYSRDAVQSASEQFSTAGKASERNTMLIAMHRTAY